MLTGNQKAFPNIGMSIRLNSAYLGKEIDEHECRRKVRL